MLRHIAGAIHRAIARNLMTGETGISGAEGATAPETLRQKDRIRIKIWKVMQLASADGITFSGKTTDGALHSA